MKDPVNNALAESPSWWNLSIREMNVDSCILTGHKMCEQLRMCQKSLDSICDVSSVMQQ